MHAFQILAASLAIVPSVFAQSTTPAQSLDLLNGFYHIISAGDGRFLTLDSRQGVFALSDSDVRNSTWYINSSPSGHAFIANARRGGVLTGVNGKDEGNPFNSQVQAQDVASDDLNRRRQSWKLNGFSDGTYEVVNADHDDVLDIRGGVNVGPEVILWSRNQPPSNNQRWKFKLFSLTT